MYLHHHSGAFLLDLLQCFSIFPNPFVSDFSLQLLESHYWSWYQFLISPSQWSCPNQVNLTCPPEFQFTRPFSLLSWCHRPLRSNECPPIFLARIILFFNSFFFSSLSVSSFPSLVSILFAPCLLFSLPDPSFHNSFRRLLPLLALPPLLLLSALPPLLLLLAFVSSSCFYRPGSIFEHIHLINVKIFHEIFLWSIPARIPRVLFLKSCRWFSDILHVLLISELPHLFHSGVSHDACHSPTQLDCLPSSNKSYHF